MALIKISKKGNILIEVVIAMLLVGIITASLLNFNTFSHNLLIESKDNFIAMNVLDSIMTNFERDASPAAWSEQANFVIFASPTNLARLNNIPGGKGARIRGLLSQLRNWNIEYSITTNSGTIYKDRLVVLRISWNNVMGGNNKVREIFSIFTSRAW